jgi:hypothetical protein
MMSMQEAMHKALYTEYSHVLCWHPMSDLPVFFLELAVGDGWYQYVRSL